MANNTLHALKSDLEIKNGTCHVLVAFDVGLGIDLNACEKLITENKQRTKIRRNHKAPTYFDYHPAPLRITQNSTSQPLGQFMTRSTVEATLYDFGAISIAYTIPLSGPFEGLLRLSQDLYDNEMLLMDAHERTEQLLEAIKPAVLKPAISDTHEDYCIYAIESFDTDLSLNKFLIDQSQNITRVLRSESEIVSDEEVNDALACRISYSPGDLAVIDWNMALLFGSGTEDVCAVLEFCNVELLEMRNLDQYLDKVLEESYQALTRKSLSKSAKLKRIGQLQVDSAILFEGVNNALKLLGDQYLARAYSLAAKRFHLAEWDTSIIRKLNTVDSIYNKLSDFSAQKRLEVLEWIIILLISLSIALSLFGLAH